MNYRSNEMKEVKLVAILRENTKVCVVNWMLKRWLTKKFKFRGHSKLSRVYMIKVEFEVRIPTLYDNIRPADEF